MMPVSRAPVGCSHTLTEILSQPGIWRSCLRSLRSDPAFELMKSNASTLKSWLFVGCGTSFYLAEAAASCWTLLTGQAAHAIPASELLLFPQLAKLNAPELQAVIISRSGRTSEAVRAAELLSQKHSVATFAITCAPASELARACDQTIALPYADENSMVMTRSFSSMLLAILQLSAEVAADETFPVGIESIIGSLDSRIHRWSAQIEVFVSKQTFDDYIYLGQGPFFSIAREAALKVTEMSHSYAQAYHTLEFRHGPKSIVAPQTCIAFFLSESGMEAETEVLLEMKELGGTIIAVCKRATESVRKACDLLFELEIEAPEPALVVPFIVPAQLLGYHTGVRKGFNPDEPKNLSRVVILD